MCIGNDSGGDDAIGPYIANILNDKKEVNLFVIDCGIIPENYTSIVKKQNPKNLIIIDAVDMRQNHGEIKIVPKEKIGEMTISTHGMPLSVLIKYLEQYIENIILIGIQPKVMIGEMTEIMKKSANNLIEIILKRDFNKIKTLE